MNNPKIEVDIGDILNKLDSKLDRLSDEIKADQKKILEEISDIKVGLETVKGDIKALDEKLSGQIKAVDEKLSGQIKTLDAKVDQIDKRVGNQEFLNRGVFIGLILALLGGVINFFGWIPKQ